MGLGVLNVAGHDLDSSAIALPIIQQPTTTGLDALDFDNKGQAIWKTHRNAPQPIDLLSRC
jgi:hypothetical protein